MGQQMNMSPKQSPEDGGRAVLRCIHTLLWISNCSMPAMVHFALCARRVFGQEGESRLI
jgi:hypothetical protein